MEGRGERLGGQGGVRGGRREEERKGEEGRSTSGGVKETEAPETG